jgi:rhodanese-related sulfurtransferase
MEIGLFQLENLIISRMPFTLLDIRIERGGELPHEIDRCLKVAQAVASAEVEKFLTDEGGAKDRPILLVCESGVTSSKLAEKLEATGFTNVYVVAGGVEGLLSELR